MKRIVLISILFSFSYLLAQIPNQECLKVKGITTDGRLYSSSRLANVTINIYQFNDKIGSYQSDAKGIFEFEIEMNSYIVLEFEKENFFSKRILFDTRNDNIDYSKKYIPFNFEIMMLEQKKKVNYGDCDFPITRIEYSVEEKEFFYVDKYTDNMIKKQEKVMARLARLQ
ncbi:MAG: hypothetical protein A3K10_15445 [Bacteroidetes bacterium RIFCSPLOWO2_12_FULL_31_6]|nr:MAG: hypothetical protein A3K10_15445 [Bacteroidetes bacterium RIFCSPLOWO2_12_FULL_31_6]